MNRIYKITAAVLMTASIALMAGPAAAAPRQNKSAAQKNIHHVSILASGGSTDIGTTGPINSIWTDGPIHG
ncbi:MAG: hypothetical protein OSA06_09335 [Acidimicrobiales bacterium]|nr:hypothetical protein [Acidimicrobiales bacterium]